MTETVSTLTGAIAVLVTVLIFIFSRITARFVAIERNADKRVEDVRKETIEQIGDLSRKLSHHSKALTKIVQNQRVQTRVVSKLITEQESLEEAVSELKTLTRLISQQMTQHQEWHRDILEAVDNANHTRVARSTPVQA